MSDKKALTKKIFNIIFYAVCAVVMLFLVYTVIEIAISRFKHQLPSLFGYSLHYVVTDSMEPEIMTGELVWAKKATYEELTPMEDTVIYFNPYYNVYIVHKLKAKEQTDNGYSYTTYGVNPNISGKEDTYHASQIDAVVVGHSKALGNFANILRTPLYLAVLIVAIILILSIPSIVKWVSKKVKKFDEEKEQKD